MAIFTGARKKIDIQAAADPGFAMIASDMTMEMHMLDIMYAISDDLTLMLMPQYRTMEMYMEFTPMLTAMLPAELIHGSG